MLVVARTAEKIGIDRSTWRNMRLVKRELIGLYRGDDMAKGMGDMLKQVQKMQQKLADLQDDLENLTVEGTSGGGMVRVVANGKGELTQIKIEPEAVDPEDVEMLEDLILAAVNLAKERSSELQQEKMAKVTGGLKLPGMPGMGF